MRLLFFGMRCAFSPPVLAALIDAGHAVTAIVVPGPPEGTAPVWRWERKPGATPGLPIAGPPTLDTLAARHAIPLARAGDLRHPDLLRAVRELRPDLIVVACFPRLLPGPLVSLARYGGINLHPSLLPAFRGPEPLFWTLRAGQRESGVTAHQLSDQFDAGAIYAQTRVSVPFGERLDGIEHRFARAAGQLAVSVIASIEQGTARPLPQDERAASPAPFPNGHDFIIPADWTAERAFAFARALAPLGGPLAVTLPDGRIVPVADAETWAAELPGNTATDPTCDSFWVPFVTGYVCFQKSKT